MFKIQIKNLQNIVTHQAQFESEQSCLDWLNVVKVTGAFGKLQRNVKEISEGVLDNNEDISKSIGSVEMTDVLGNIIKIHNLPQEFSHEIIDISDELLAQQESDNALKYLASTDWMVVRKAETGVDYPQEIKDLRAAARLKVL